MSLPVKTSLNRNQKIRSILSEDSKMTRKVRVIFHDPYATDSSSSEDECEVRPRAEKGQKRKRVIREVKLPFLALSQAKSLQSGSSSQYSNSKPGANGKGVLAKTPDDTPKPTKVKKPVGIRQRKWGKWAAEIRHPITKKRTWLGTYNTLEEATNAYNAKKLEYDLAVAAASDKTSNISSSAAASQNISGSYTAEESESMFYYASPVSILELDTSASAYVSNIDDTRDWITEGYNFVGLSIPDFCFVDEPLVSSAVEEDLNLGAESDDDFVRAIEHHLFGIQGDDPSELPDDDFNPDEFLVDGAGLNFGSP
ncbi:hypothetical protein SLEP1_g51201 [Rubroshorea leprosula]|uniref:AP2/ERF domain-containing protein n=1 Tax=Rubroshorea leprosula TaxID=152421 RepID=A0AAV5M2F4_9ROSI|nr:hypothetical protein SLEP1_g51201 [Rubroshorea leprosula]